MDPGIREVLNTFGFPTSVVIFGGLFLWKVVWPWWTSQVDRYAAVIDQNTRIAQQVLGALQAMRDELARQPNTQIAECLSTLTERMDQQHAQIMTRIDAHDRDMAGRLDKIDSSVRN